jgi:hypothetical protein
MAILGWIRRMLLSIEGRLLRLFVFSTKEFGYSMESFLCCFKCDIRYRLTVVAYGGLLLTVVNEKFVETVAPDERSLSLPIDGRADRMNVPIE